MTSGSTTQNQHGNQAKRRNHTVPKALLKRWLTEADGKLGHWVLDCKSGDIDFRLGSEASFAIRDFVYVPIRSHNGAAPYRDETVEDWFSLGENDLALVTDWILKKEPIEHRTKAVGRLLQAVIALGFRSAYEYDTMARAVKSTNQMLSNEEVARLVVDSFKKTYTGKLRQFANWDYAIVEAPEEPLLVCDRPMFDMTVSNSQEELLVVPLTPFLMLTATAPSDRARTGPSWTQGAVASANIVSLANHLSVERARQFVVGALDQLKKIQPRFLHGAFESRKATDGLVIQGRTFGMRVPTSEF